jgi:hypothetical protein
MQTYTHEENTNNLIEYCPNENKISKWVSGSWKKSKTLIKNKINSGYLILPMYDDEEWQTQISGKAKIGESMAEAAQREIFEEIGIVFDVKTIYNSYLDYEKFKGCDVAYFLLNLNDCINNSDYTYNVIQRKCYERQHHEDEKRKRVSIFLYFNYTDDINPSNLSNLLSRNRLLCDDIAGKNILILDKTKLYNLM